MPQHYRIKGFGYEGRVGAGSPNDGVRGERQFPTVKVAPNTPKPISALERFQGAPAGAGMPDFGELSSMPPPVRTPPPISIPYSIEQQLQAWQRIGAKMGLRSEEGTIPLRETLGLNQVYDVLSGLFSGEGTASSPSSGIGSIF